MCREVYIKTSLRLLEPTTPHNRSTKVERAKAFEGETMSTRKGTGSTRTRKPAHQNTFAYRHNPKSKKTAKILDSVNTGLCAACHDKVRRHHPIATTTNCTQLGFSHWLRARPVRSRKLLCLLGPILLRWLSTFRVCTQYRGLLSRTPFTHTLLYMSLLTSPRKSGEIP